MAEDADELGEMDVGKVRIVVQVTGFERSFDSAAWDMKRLSQQDTQQTWLVFVTVKVGRERNEIIKKAKNLKEPQGSLASVHVRKDIHLQ